MAARSRQPDPGSQTLNDPIIDRALNTAGTYQIIVGSRTAQGTNEPLALKMSYQLNVSLERHATNPDAISLKDAKARGLFKTGWKVHIADSAGRRLWLSWSR